MTMTHQDTTTAGQRAGELGTVLVGPSSDHELPADLAHLVSFTEPELDLDDIVLDVPCGTGHVARVLSHRVRHVTALDTDEDLLEEGKRIADQAAITSITFGRGDAAYLPFLPRSFTLVMSSFVVHRLGDPAAALRQLARVCRPGAGLIVADIVRPDPAAGSPAGVDRSAGDNADLDRIERLRDPEHVRVFTLAEITALIAGAGAEVKRSATVDVVRPVDAWLSAAGTPAEAAAQIRSALTAEIEGGPATGLRPALVDGVLTVTHTHAHLMAVAH